MKRIELVKFCDELVSEFEKLPVSHWNVSCFPRVEERVVHGTTVDVELNLLEDKPKYIHIGVALSDRNWIRKLMPVTRSFIVNK